MRFLKSIKWRMTTSYLLVLLVILCLFIGFSYFLLARAVYSNEAVPLIVYTTEINIPDNALTGSGVDNNNYNLLHVYTIRANKLRSIQDVAESIIRIGTPIGVLPLDQSKFISNGTEGDHNVWIYYRLSPVDLNKYELMMVVRPSSETRLILGQFTDILIYALPVTLILVFVVGFFLLKRMLRPIDAITATVQRINSKNPYRKMEIPRNSEFGELTASLNQAFGRLQETVNRERQLVADASHEIRAPLTVMQGEATLALRRKRTVEEYEQCLQVFSRESAYLAAMVNKLLLVAYLDNATELLNAEDVNLSDFLTELSPSFKLLCEEHTLTFKFETEAGIHVRGDKSKLRELFFNLIDNAVKYNHSNGQVSLSLKAVNGYARADVSDKGIGIQQEQLGRLFERFYRVDKSSSRNEGGTGLGLAISQRIAELHGGKISVASKVNVGSTFTVELPIKSSKEPA